MDPAAGITTTCTLNHAKEQEADRECYFPPPCLGVLQRCTMAFVRHSSSEIVLSAPESTLRILTAAILEGAPRREHLSLHSQTAELVLPNEFLDGGTPRLRVLTLTDTDPSYPRCRDHAVSSTHPGRPTHQGVLEPTRDIQADPDSHRLVGSLHTRHRVRATTHRLSGHRPECVVRATRLPGVHDGADLQRGSWRTAAR